MPPSHVNQRISGPEKARPAFHGRGNLAAIKERRA